MLLPELPAADTDTDKGRQRSVIITATNRDIILFFISLTLSSRLFRLFVARDFFCNNDRYRDEYNNEAYYKRYYAAFSERHRQLRGQIASLVLPVCGDGPDRKFLSEFIAESLLIWTTEGKPFEDMYSIIKRLIQKEREESQNEQL